MRLSLLWDSLSGDWRFKRSIEENHEVLEAHGKASWVLESSGSLLYSENGYLSIEGQSYPFSRSYRYVLKGDAVEIYFVGHRNYLFQSVSLVEKEGALIGKGEHPCGDDMYLSYYRFELPNSLCIRHKVNGPKKNSLITTHYAKL
jgi:hypothetical protein